jgi:hypothetical protein
MESQIRLEADVLCFLADWGGFGWQLNLVDAVVWDVFTGLLKYGRTTELWGVEGPSCLRWAWALREKSGSLEG